MTRFKNLTLVAASLLLLSINSVETRAEGRTAYPSTAVDGLPYSGVVKAQGMVYVGGVLGTKPGTGELVSGGVENETRQALTMSRT